MPSMVNMNAVLPTPSTTIGPDWAQELNAALIQSVDTHDHSSGKGVKITPAGLNINTALDFQNQQAINMQIAALQNLDAATSTINAVSVTGGNLWFTNGSGVPVQITAGGSVVSSPAAVQSFGRTFTNASITISPSATYVVVEVDSTGGPKNITLPVVAAVSDGRTFIVKDVAGQARANPITILPQGTDTIDDAASVVLDSRYGAIMLVGDATSNYAVA